MRPLRSLAIRFLGLFRSRPADSDFSAELESNIALHTDDLIRAGLTPAEARRQALIRLGGAEQTRQAHREHRTIPWLESMLRDLGYALRTLAKHPAATAIAILSIGLGIGANATIFSIVNRFVLRPPPMGDPSTLLAIHTTHDGDECCNQFPYPVYADLRDQAQSFSGVAAYDELIPASISGSGEPDRVWGQAVTSNFFSVTELPMVLGRGFASGEENAQDIVLGADLWRRRFNADPNIAGKTITLSGHAYTVIGVVTPAFHGADQILYTEFWVPLGIAPQLAPNAPSQSARQFHWLNVLARLKPGITRDAATAELSTLAGRFGNANPATDKGNRFVFEQAGSLPPRERSTVLIFFAALSFVVLLVLSIACANVANLLFAQAAARQREMAVRLALGSTRGRLQRQVLTESLLLGVGGGVLGVLLSLGSTRGLSSFRLPVPVPLDVAVDVDWRVLVYSFALSVVCGLLLGLAPAWAASRPLIANALKGEDALARPGRRFTLRNLLVVAQIAMSVILLCVTGLFLRSLQSASTIDIGFRTDNTLMMSFDPSVHGYSPERSVNFMMQLRDHVAALPGVVSAVVTDGAPLSGYGRADGFRIPGSPDTPSSWVNTTLVMVTPGYFEALGIHRIAGSDFGAETATDPRMAIANKAFVEKVLGGRNPIGTQVDGAGSLYRIIGVVENVKARTLGEETTPVLYRSLRQTVASDPSSMGYTLLVHTAGNPTALRQSVRNQIYALDRSMAIYNEETMEEHIRSAFFLPHLAAILFGTFGFIGLVLAAIGLYGVMSYSVSRRTREIGIRMALGAQPGTVERLILRQGMVLTLIALVLGWPAAWMLAKMASSFLYGIQPHDALTFALVPPFLAVIALIACYVPARRAAAVDPMRALRTE
jgi:predicted permease